MGTSQAKKDFPKTLIATMLVLFPPGPFDIFYTPRGVVDFAFRNVILRDIPFFVPSAASCCARWEHLPLELANVNRYDLFENFEHV